jgi:hypothetical protein
VSTEGFIQWAVENSSGDNIDRLVVGYGIAIEAIGHKAKEDYSYFLHWDRFPGQQGSHRCAMASVQEGSRIANSTTDRAVFFQEFIDKLGVGGLITIAVLPDQIQFNANPPWHVYPSPNEPFVPRYPSHIRIFPFHDATSLRENASKLLRHASHPVVAMTLLTESHMPSHNRICETIPAEYEGWEMNCFGCPSDQLQGWFAGDLQARPPGRIPIGRGWEGDSNHGFAYSVSVVETPNGPCIELGSDNATHERLQTLSKYFEGLEFHPL